MIAKLLDTAQTYCWYNNSLSQVSLAVNRWTHSYFPIFSLNIFFRFVVTVLLRLHFFTPFRAVLISVSQHILALTIAVTIQYILPCCGWVASNPLNLQFLFIAEYSSSIQIIHITKWSRMVCRITRGLTSNYHSKSGAQSFPFLSTQ